MKNMFIRFNAAKFLAFIFILSFSCCKLFGQDTTQLPPFAIVYMSDIVSKGECFASYSNGVKEDLLQTLNLPVRPSRSIATTATLEKDFESEKTYELGMLQYMYKRGYELLSTFQETEVFTYREFYFKRK